MPIIRFSHADEVRDLDASVMLMSEAESCESLTGWTDDEWRSALVEQKVAALRFAWWLAGKRAGVEERFSGIDLDLRKLAVRVVPGEDEEPVGVDAEEGVGADLPTGPDGGQEATG